MECTIEVLKAEITRLEGLVKVEDETKALLYEAMLSTFRALLESLQ